MIDFSKNYFALFDLEPVFQIDLAPLEKNFRALQAQVHPDKFSSAGDAERRLSMQCSTHVNTAYQTLKTPLTRARYLLSLQGVDTQEETNTAMPTQFLMEQMEWREAISDARDLTTLNKIALQLRSANLSLLEEIGQRIDQQHDYAGAAEAVRKLRFLDKLGEDINDAFEVLEA